jgi:ABC-type sulfate transport system permease subunit
MNRTRMIILAIWISLGIYDAWVCSAGNFEASISQFIVDLVNVSPVAYGVICVLIGHFGFPMISKFKTPQSPD